jgi:hypothetical protein
MIEETRLSLLAMREVHSVFRIAARCSTHQLGESCIFEPGKSLKKRGSVEKATCEWVKASMLV